MPNIYIYNWYCFNFDLFSLCLPLSPSLLQLVEYTRCYTIIDTVLQVEKLLNAIFLVMFVFIIWLFLFFSNPFYTFMEMMIKWFTSSSLGTLFFQLVQWVFVFLFILVILVFVVLIFVTIFYFFFFWFFLWCVFWCFNWSFVIGNFIFSLVSWL